VYSHTINKQTNNPIHTYTHTGEKRLTPLMSVIDNNSNYNTTINKNSNHNVTNNNNNNNNDDDDEDDNMTTTTMEANGWIECICICSFDIELGQKIEQIFPKHYTSVLSHNQQSDVAYLSFPDGNNGFMSKTCSSSRDEDVQNIEFTFRIKEEKRGEDAQEEFLFGHVYFRQRKDSTVQRGYVMKSVVLISRFPFLKLYRYLTKRIAMLYFENESVCNALFSQVFSEAKKWNTPTPGLQYDLPFMGQKIMYRTPLYCPTKAQLLTLNNINSGSICHSRRMKVNFSQTMKKRMSSNDPPNRGNKKKGNAFDKNGVTPVTPLKERLLGRKYPFQHEINLFSTFRKHIESNNLVKYWELVITGEPILVVGSNPTQCSDAVLSLVSMIAPIHYAGDYRPYLTVHNSDFKIFARLGDPDPFIPCIIGTTNPFFIKAYENWPHIIIVSNTNNQTTGSNAKTTPEESKKVNNILSNILSSNPLINKKKQNEQKRKQLMWDSDEIFWTNKSNFVVKSSFQGPDTSWNHLSTNLLYLDAKDNNRDSADGINNEQIRKFFEELTEAFLVPIHRCFDTLVCSMKTFIVRSEHKKVFKPERFFSYIEKHGYNEALFDGRRADILEMYKKFIYSRNFASWMEQQILEAYYNDVLHTDISQLLKDVSEVGMIDLFLRLKEELELEKQGMGLSYGDTEIIGRLQLFLIQILQCLPQSLSENLTRQLDSDTLEKMKTIQPSVQATEKKNDKKDTATIGSSSSSNNVQQELQVTRKEDKKKVPSSNDDSIDDYFM
jgi:hypothetical protein